MASYGPTDETGRVMICQLCGEGRLDEVHMVVSCKEVQDSRSMDKIGSQLKREKEEAEDKMYRKLLSTMVMKNERTRREIAKFLQNMKSVFMERWMEKVDERRNFNN